MAKRNGGIIGPDNVPSGMFGSAGGVWRLEDAFNYQKAGLWPIPLGYQIPNSLRFNRPSSDYLSRIPASAGSTTKGTFSLWFKLSELAATRSGAYQMFYSVSDGGSPFFISIDDGDKLHIAQYNGASYDFQYVSTQLLRDVSAWYHLVVAIDTTQGTASNRVRTYLNGSEVTSWGTQTNPSSSLTVIMFKNSSTNIGRYAHTSAQYYSGYIAEQYGIDGQQLTPSSFGETDSTTGIWTPKAYTGTYGTNGFYLKFANSASLGTDSSGNGNNFTVNNLTSIDQSYDSPTNNFATMNPLKPTSDATFSNGNLTVLYGTSATRTVGQGTIGVSSGKWFWENKISGSVSPNNAIVGITSNSNDTDTVIGTSSNNFGYRGYDGAVYNNNASVASLSTFTDGDIIGIALDLTNNLIYFYKNGTVQNSGTGISISGATNTSGFWYPAISDAGSSATPQFDINFGYPPFTIASGNADANGFGNFEYAVPSGYYALCSKNLALYG